MLRRSLLQFPFPLLLQGQQQRPTPLQILEASILRITQSLNAQWGIYLKCLETGEEIALDADRQMDTMSVIKIPLMVEVFRQIEAGRFSLTDRIKLRDEDKRPGTGVIRSMDAGLDLTIKDLITLMIIVSDNTATDLLFEKTGGVDATNVLMKQYGYTKIRATAPPKPGSTPSAPPLPPNSTGQGRTPTASAALANSVCSSKRSNAAKPSAKNPAT